MPDAAKKLFISYAWEGEEYREWVRRLATRFCEDGVEARLDFWHLQATDTIPEFMNREVRQADWVLVLCSPAYKSKIHATEEGQRSTGAGWEARLLTSRLFISSENKMLAALAKGTWTESAPDFLQGQIYSDLSDPKTFEANYKTLLQRITGTFEAPPPVRPLRPDLKPEPLAALRYEAPAASPAEIELLFTVRAAEPAGRWTVELRAGEGEPVSAPFELDLSPGGQTHRDLEAIEKNTCTTDDIQNLGSELWARLLAGPLEKEWERVRRQCRAREGSLLKVRLSLPPQLESLPWESIWDFDEASLATSPVASLVRSPTDEELPAPHRPAGTMPLKVLVMIPAGSGLRTSSEWEKIRQSALAADGRVEIESLDGQVTLNRFAAELRRDWDVVHFIGHGRLDAHGSVELRLNREEPDGEDWISARLFAQQFRRSPVRLVVVNCCHAASLDPQALSGLSGYLARGARVAATLVMRYAIHDSVAADFSAAFYRELFSGERPGRVDLAAQEGRAALERTYRDGDRARGAITPVLYLAPGCEQLFKPPEKESAAAAVVAMQTFAVIDERIDRKLVRAIEKRCCLPILGPGILNAGAERQEQIPPSPGGLAQRLAQLSAFPGSDRITPLTDTVDWLTPVVFERICQHFESSSDGERHALNEAIQEVYRPFVPHPALDQIAGWNVPGVVYTYVDGLLEQSLQRLRGRDLRVVQAEDLREGTLPGSGGLVLMNLRGSYMAPSMVLTEEDQDRLLDRISAVASFVADLMNRIGGCNLLFLGISARDPLVRALARRLLRDDVARNRGTAFFICDQTTVADRSYWQQFKKLEWLELDIDTVVTGLTTAARAAGRPEGEP